MDKNHTAVVTIASKNYFAQVKTLLDSLRETNPLWDRFFAIADEPNAQIISLLAEIDSTLISLEELDIPDLNDMKFRYDIMEFNTAIKPFVLLKLMEQYDRVIYLDPDICVYAEMEEINRAFDSGYHFILTPHLSDYFPDDGFHPSEPDIMKSGVYNLGFLAVDNSDDARIAIRWWADRLETLCVNRQRDGIFVDQKWMDLLPGRHDGIYILRNNGYNTAYWNLSHRKAEKDGNTICFNGDKLVFFHFSGYDPLRPDIVSKHQDRYRMDETGVCKELFYDYRDRILGNGFEALRTLPYAFQTFTDGRAVLSLFRMIYRDDPKIIKAMKGKNPFDCPQVFYHHKDSTADAIIEYLLRNDAAPSIGFMAASSSDWANWIQTLLRQTYHVPGDWVRFITSRFLAHVSSNHPSSREGQKLDGVNLVGYLRSEIGLGESGRMTGIALETAGVSWCGYDWEEGNSSRKDDHSIDNYISQSCPYDVSVFHINADQLPIAYDSLPKEAWQAYRIGIWYWELPEFPAQWWNAFDLLDEIWAPSRFIYDTLKKCSPIPVHYVPAPMIKDEPKKQYSRKFFGLPEDAFLFLNYFDSFSYASRKNPAAAIKAFQAAFKPDDSGVGLVLKINNASPDAKLVSELKETIGEYKNIFIIARVMPRDEINGLICCCDASVSLHRSEGLGLLCKESMYYGKPVIATNWSGNTEFMNEDNSCLVDYTMVPVDYYEGVKSGEQQWAEADVEQASAYMVQLVEDREFYTRIAKNAKAYIRKTYSAENVGKQMAARLAEIHKNRHYWADKHLSNEQSLTEKNILVPAVGTSALDLYRDPGYGRDMNAAMRECSVLNSSWQLPYYRELGKRSPITFIKRVIRKLLTFLINPICSDQTDFNATAVRNINELIHKFQVQTMFNNAVASALSSDEKTEEIERLNNQVLLLEKRLAALEGKSGKRLSHHSERVPKRISPTKK